MRSTGWVTPRRAVAAVLAILLAAAGILGLGVSGRLPGGVPGGGAADDRDTSTPTASPTPARSPAGPVLTPADGPATPGRPPAITVLRRLLATDALGADPGAVVLDAATGELLLDHGASQARTPASVAKLATGAAALVALGPDNRLATRALAGASRGEVVLVGGGDATLTVRRPRRADYPRRASLAELADATAAALASRGSSTVTVRVDDGLFAGPAVSPEWEPSYVPAGEVSPVSALAVDAGRVRPGSDQRETDPALAAGADFARLLRARGLAVRGQVRRTTAPAGGPELGVVSSPPVAALVETMLADSDNDLAESLCRLVGQARGRPASFAGGTTEVASVLSTLGVPTRGLRLLDGSGLARGSAIAPETLARLLVLAGDAERPELRPLLTGLPVAGFSGTLDDRFGVGDAVRGDGLVRAKTGTLTGVSSLAGLADDHGRLLVFAVLADRIDPADTLAAEDALDRFAAALTTRAAQVD